MNLLRLTIIDPYGGISFVAPGDALPALLKACTTDPPATDELIARAEQFYSMTTMLTDYRSLYDQLAGKRASPASTAAPRPAPAAASAATPAPAPATRRPKGLP